MTPKPTPTYDLALIQEKIANGHYGVTGVAAEGAQALYLDEADIIECVLSLTSMDFRKTMPASKRPGFFQDVYKTHYCGFPVYVKLQILDDDRAWIIAFKRDESP